MQQNLFEAFNVPRNIREAQFVKFHQENPKVYQLWDRFTKEAIAKGHTKIGSAMILERIRWETSVATVNARPDGERLKLNNNFKSYYARLWMSKNPQHKDIFPTKRVEGDNE
jgi:hypothetical protein